MASPAPSHAQVVVVGGGIAGASTAYHLTKLGCTDVVLLEQGRLTCGTTSPRQKPRIGAPMRGFSF